MLFGDQRLQAPDIDSALVTTDVLHRYENVDAVRTAVDLTVDPRQRRVELVGRIGGRAEHAEPAGVGHRGNDIPAVAERDDRELNPKHLCDTRLHSVILALRAKNPR